MKGMTIVEVMVALGAGTVILTALTFITITSLSNARQSSSQTLSSQYAQEGMETMRNMKNTDWATFSILPSQTYCLADTCSAIKNANGTCGINSPACGLNVAGRYVRQIVIKQNDATCVPPTPVVGRSYIKVISSVAWTDSTCTDSSNPYCHSNQIESCFSNFDARQTP